jgi:hypothetical protein
MRQQVQPASKPDVVLRGRFERGEERRYRHIPFGVPPGLRQLHIRIAYNDRISSDPRAGGGNTLDVGLFDERGSAPGSPGFRGWSGSERLEITIDERWATPPYRAGPIGSGMWQILLGPYKIGPNGLDYEIAIWFDAGLLPEPVMPAEPHSSLPPPPPAAEAGWVRGDMHCHSLYSDGDSWPEELLLEAKRSGLDFLAITDHNGAVRHTAPAGQRDALPLLIPGNEATTYRGHWNVWGIDGWFDFRDVTLEAMQAEMRRATAAGGTVSVNHPKPWGPAWDYADMTGAHAIEVWNGPWERLNAISVAEWEERLLRGERHIAVGGSDTHIIRVAPGTGPMRRPWLGEPTIWVDARGDLSAAAVLAGIRAGRCFLSASPAGPQLYLTGDAAGVTVRVVGGVGAMLHLIAGAELVAAHRIDHDDWPSVMEFPDGRSYLRAEVVGPGEQMLAFSNPIWRTPS